MLSQRATVLRYYAVSVTVPDNTVHLQSYLKTVHVPEKKQHDSATDSTRHFVALEMTRLLSLAAHTSSSLATDNYRNLCIDFHQHKFCIDSLCVNYVLHGSAFRPHSHLAAFLDLFIGQCLTVAILCVASFTHIGVQCYLICTSLVKCWSWKHSMVMWWLLSRVWVTIDGFWIDERISTARDCTLQVSLTHSLTHYCQLPLLGSGFQKRTFSFLRVPELPEVSATSFSQQWLTQQLNLSSSLTHQLSH
jgi:hypothetical protein